MNKYVAIDIGGTAIKYGIIDQNGEITNRKEIPTEAWRGGPIILEKVISIVEEQNKETKIKGICISTAGMVDVEKGEIFHSAPLIPAYTGTKFKEKLEQKFAIPCEVENDVNCAGLAESISGAAMESTNTLVLTIGTGIGGCILLNKEVFHGFQNSACEVGYMHMGESDFQTLGAASILTKKVATEKGEAEALWNGHRIFQEAREGDEVCMRAIDEMTDILGQGIANICYVINPQMVVLGGGIMAQEEYLRTPIEHAVKRYLIPSIAAQTKIEFAYHKNNAGMLGAFYHFAARQGISLKK